MSKRNGLTADLAWSRYPGLRGYGADEVVALATDVENRLAFALNVERHDLPHLRPQPAVELPDRETGPITLAELLAQPAPAIAWTVADLLPVGGVSLLASRPKVGKSTASRGLCVAVARGQGEWFGREVMVGGPVLGLFVDESPATIARHFARLEADPDRIHVVTADRLPNPPDRMAALDAWVSDLKPALVVIDLLARFLPGVTDTNDYASVTAATTPLLQLARERETHIAMLMHTRKSGGSRGDAVLGSTAWTGAVDTVVELRRIDGVVTVRAHGRDDVELAETATMLRDDGHVAVTGTVAEVRQAERAEVMQDRILTYLWGQLVPSSRDAVLASVEGKAKAVLAALAQLVEDGRILCTGTGKRGDPKMYEYNRQPD